jgi:hypothetical protein
MWWFGKKANYTMGDDPANSVQQAMILSDLAGIQ